MTLRPWNLGRAALSALALAFATAPACKREEAAPPSGGNAKATITVAAASSLKDLLEGTKASFEATHPESTLRFSFDASSALSRQIEAGGAFDCFLSADAANVDRLGDKLDAKSRVRFLSNHLVVVTRSDLPAPVTDVEGLKSLPGKLALAGEAVPVGKYARAWLTKKGVLKDLEPRIVIAENVRAVLALVEAGTADAGVVYASDARVAVRAKLAFAAAKDDEPGIEYVAATSNGASVAAHDYVQTLLGAPFQEAAERLGFVRAPK